MRGAISSLWFPPYVRRLVRRVIGEPRPPAETPVRIERLRAAAEADAIYAVTARAVRSAERLAVQRSWLANGDADLDRLLGEIERQAHANTKALIRRYYAPEVQR